MRDKHIHSEHDSKLLRLIHTKVEQELNMNPHKTKRILVFKFVFYDTLMVIAYTIIYTMQNSAWLFIAYSSFGLLSVLLGFNFAHDLCHNTVFRSRAINHWGFVSIYTLLGAHAEAWKYRHTNSHHYAPNVKDYDSDLQITSLIRVEPGSRHRWFHRLQHLYAPIAYTTYSLYWVFIKDFIIYFTGKSTRRMGTVLFHASFWVQKTVYLAYMLVLPLLYSPHGWMAIASAFLVMHLVQSLFLLFTFFMTHHTEQTAYFDTDKDGFISTSWFSNQVKSSNDFYPFSRTANFIFGGFNNHIAHHLFPHVHHIHYPRLNRILYRVLLEHDIRPNATTFAGGIVSHLRHLKNLSVPKAA